MKNPKDIRNIALLGSSGAGKTTLIEQMLYNAKMTTRVGKVEDGNTVMDFDADEIEKKMSISMGLGYFERNNVRVNLIDTPGYPDFNGEALAAATAVETVIVVANASGMYDVGIELALEHMKASGHSKAILINRMDNEQADYDKVLENIQDNAEVTPAPIFIPIGRESTFQGIVNLITGKAYIHGKPADIPADLSDRVEEYRLKLMEAVAESDDDLMSKYFEEGELTQEEMVIGIRKGIVGGSIIPVFCTSAGDNIGVENLMDAIIEYLPSPADYATTPAVKREETIEIDNGGEKLYAFIFKSFADPNLGDVAYVRIFSGVLHSGMDVYIPEKNAKDKIGNMYHIQGKNRKDTSELHPGEIGGLVKLRNGRGLNTLLQPGEDYHYPTVQIPDPVYWQSIHAVNQSDEDKIGTALQRLLDEDPTLRADFDPDTKQQVVSAMGEQQIGLLQKRLKRRYKVDAEFHEPRIPYRETITGKSEKSYRHKKQTGGRGQFGDVHFRVAPRPRGEGFEFIDAIVGGVIPSKFIPAVEKGVVETMEKGIIAGYKVVDISVELFFGSYHDVDSSEMAFKIAASQCLKSCFSEANPILLEPIHDVKIVIPTEYMGDVMGDISTRRGKILGMEQKGKKQILNAQLPLSELYGYFPALKSLTQGRGRYSQTFSHYEKVPHDITQKVIAEYEEAE